MTVFPTSVKAVATVLSYTPNGDQLCDIVAGIVGRQFDRVEVTFRPTSRTVIVRATCNSEEQFFSFRKAVRRIARGLELEVNGYQYWRKESLLELSANTVQGLRLGDIAGVAVGGQWLWL